MDNVLYEIGPLLSIYVVASLFISKCEYDFLKSYVLLTQSLHKIWKVLLLQETEFVIKRLKKIVTRPFLCRL